MGIVVCGKYRVVWSLRMEGVIPHRESLRDLLGDLGVRLLQVAADDASSVCRETQSCTDMNFLQSGESLKISSFDMPDESH